MSNIILLINIFTQKLWTFISSHSYMSFSFVFDNKYVYKKRRKECYFHTCVQQPVTLEKQIGLIFFAKCLLTFSFTSNTLTTFYIKQILENVWKTYFDLDDTKITKYCWYFKTSWSDFTYSHWFHFLFQSMDSSRKSRPWNAKANVYSPWQPSYRRAVDAKGKALKLFSKYRKIMFLKEACKALL